MLLKLLTLLGVLVMLYGMARRAAALFGAAGAPAPQRVTDMVRCGVCGAWHATAEPCHCRVPPTP